ncbi:hypothetical protein NP233_g7687 [Leucocoprinus birnbaumii]|uniref:CCHC-type domain-containing protein n=1 Tax=Leucocoprinus birnbaumii TaxID=56174 RepID=A0AAD5YUH9_9AGAR|nr:hypothetical protein NP233_g7687 [Leucocoprinus birnbaumii]
MPRSTVSESALEYHSTDFFSNDDSSTIYSSSTYSSSDESTDYDMCTDEPLPPLQYPTLDRPLTTDDSDITISEFSTESTTNSNSPPTEHQFHANLHSSPGDSTPHGPHTGTKSRADCRFNGTAHQQFRAIRSIAEPLLCTLCGPDHCIPFLDSLIPESSRQNFLHITHIIGQIYLLHRQIGYFRGLFHQYCKKLDEENVGAAVHQYLVARGLICDDSSVPLASNLTAEPRPNHPITATTLPSNGGHHAAQRGFLQHAIRHSSQSHLPSHLSTSNGRGGPVRTVQTAFCRECQTVGHFASDCPQFHCVVCKRYKPGHYSYRCPLFVCPFCRTRQPGHRVEDCPNKDKVIKDGSNELDSDCSVDSDLDSVY